MRDSSYYWLPSGMDWSWLESQPGVIELPGTVPIAASLLVGLATHALRTAFHCAVALPLANAAGVNPSTQGFSRDVYTIATGRLDSGSGPGKRLWRFLDTSWRAAFYSVSFVYGCSYVGNKIWYADFMHCWLYWPLHEYEPQVALHYAIEAGYYWSALIVAVQEYKRKDFVINFVHHALTLLLLWISWQLNLLRVGSLVLILHDVADIILECSKMTKLETERRKFCFGNVSFLAILERYARAPEWLTTTGYVLFIVFWLVSRLFVYPQVVYSAIFEAPLLVASKHWPLMIVVGYGMLILLQVLHLVWTDIIIRALAAALQPEGHLEDTRSDSEHSDSENTQNQTENNRQTNKKLR